MTSLRSVYNLTDAPHERPTEAPSISVGPPFLICRGLLCFRGVTIRNAGLQPHQGHRRRRQRRPRPRGVPPAPAPRRRRVRRQAGALISYQCVIRSILIYTPYKDTLAHSGGDSFRRLAGCSAAAPSSPSSLSGSPKMASVAVRAPRAGSSSSPSATQKPSVQS